MYLSINQSIIQTYSLRGVGLRQDANEVVTESISNAHH